MTRTLFTLCFLLTFSVLSVTSDSVGCLAVAASDSTCQYGFIFGPDTYQIPDFDSQGPAKFDEGDAFQICADGSCGLDLKRDGPPENATSFCYDNQLHNITVLLQACNTSTGNKTYSPTTTRGEPASSSDICTLWGYAPAILVQNQTFYINCATPYCGCFQIPTAASLGGSDISEFEFGVVLIRNGIFDGTIYTADCPGPCAPSAPNTTNTTTTTGSNTGVVITTGVATLTNAGSVSSSSSESKIFSDDESSSSSSDLALILGLTLGLGIPCLLLCCALIIVAIILLLLKKGTVSSSTFWMPSRI